MRLYKFKPAGALQHLLDITVRERLFCQEYSKLNDPFEGQFRSLVHTAGALAGPIARPIVSPIVQPITGGSPQTRIRYRDLAELPFSETRVCSLTADVHDVRMWSLYAESHQGIAVEINFDGLDGSLHAVSYEADLPKFGSTILGGPNAIDVLTKKTTHWEYEKEYRIIGDQPYFDIGGRITKVILGIRASESIAWLLQKVTHPSISIVKAKLDHAGVRVITGEVVRAGESR
ncbi:DUF2971 domain-containing protein [Arenimonas sp.]|uniref:DUF2971 domain-containing protein n=1 Tax=Arenimonas sp. TaxID=1872635 RepID=UPI0039E6F16C